MARVNCGGACRHCGEEKTRWRRKGLCWRCHRSKRVKRLYPTAPNRGGPNMLTGVDLPPHAHVPPAQGQLPADRAARVAEYSRRYDRRVEVSPVDGAAVYVMARQAGLCEALAAMLR